MMDGASLTAIGAFGGALVTAIASMGGSFYQHRGIQRDRHRLHASEQHLRHYEEIYVSARLIQDAFRDFTAIEKRSTSRADPFLCQLLDIVAVRAQTFCVAVDWRHNPGMVYLEQRLEDRCLHVRELLLEWLTERRIVDGDIASVRRSGQLSPITLTAVRRLRPGDYQELRIERLAILHYTSKDRKLVAQIDRAISAVLRELKHVVSY